MLAGLAFGVVEIASGLMPSYLWFALLTPLLGITVLTMITSANAPCSSASRRPCGAG